jgi:hypothetical protein
MQLIDRPFPLSRHREGFSDRGKAYHMGIQSGFVEILAFSLGESPDNPSGLVFTD